jgi:hypothetical protein
VDSCGGWQQLDPRKADPDGGGSLDSEQQCIALTSGGGGGGLDSEQGRGADETVRSTT